MKTIAQQIAHELSVREAQVSATLKLMEEGATIPFIARYRKEATGGLNDTQLRTLEERVHYLTDLKQRRDTVLKSIEEQGKLTPTLRVAIQEVNTKVQLEDLYLPFKPKRRTKAQIAREAGLESLAQNLLKNPNLIPEQAATPFIRPDKAITDEQVALEGARQILMEFFFEDAKLLAQLRQLLWQCGTITARLVKGKEKEGAKFSDYFQYEESLKSIPSHRALAIFRGKNEDILKIKLECTRGNEDPKEAETAIERRIANHFHLQFQKRPGDRWIEETLHQAWKHKIFPHLETHLIAELREQAEEEAIRVFAKNLRALLLAAPAGQRPTIGLDPGLRTGVKLAVINDTGKVVETGVLYPHPPQNQWEKSLETLSQLVQTHAIELISIGNGTASRETDRLVLDLIKRHPEHKVQKLVVSEAGASVYSASALAAEEFPTLDVSLRGAVSIARRLQDPLAELVKIDPKAIGVGQYQHDVNQAQLERMLNAVVEDCVNAVGVDLNTASVSLLTRIAGLSASIAKNIVDYRNQHGAFPTREALKKVPRLGPKAFEQAAGFLRIMNGQNPLDASAVHPESYPLVEKILKTHNKIIQSLIGDRPFLQSLKPEDYIDERFGLPTVQDILNELEKPGRDPRPEFKTATFQEGVEEMKDLQPGMFLEGVVTNVTNFGAFVDIGVHQDGLVHISMLSNQFVKDPHTVVKTGDVVKVQVQEVDLQRKRISLSMKF